MPSEREQKEETTLENVCVDCLEKIFRYLSIPDLLNVADSSKSKQLKMAADLAFSWQYRGRVLRIEGFTSNRDYSWRYVYLLTGKLKFMLQLLRCFGYLVSRMEIALDRTDNLKLLDRNVDRLMFYVKEYCVESLTEFTFLREDLRGSSLHHFDKPFPNVYSVCVQSPVPQNMSIVELFPEMRRLTYHCAKMEELSSIGIGSGLQSLDHLEIKTVNMFDACQRWDKWEERNPMLQQSLLKLRSLSLPYHTIFPSMFDPLLNLQELKVNSMTTDIDYEPKFHSKTVKRLSMSFPAPSTASFPPIPFSFDNLEKLSLGFNATHAHLVNSSPQPFYDFISRHPTILELTIFNMPGLLRLQRLINYDFISRHPTILELTIFNMPGLLRLQRLINYLPLLERVVILGTFDIDDIIQFLNETKALQCLKIAFYHNPVNIDAHVKARLEAGWHCEKCFSSIYKFTRISKGDLVTLNVNDYC